jgi:hypothetical protein
MLGIGLGRFWHMQVNNYIPSIPYFISDFREKRVHFRNLLFAVLPEESTDGGGIIHYIPYFN